jgi:hypothetical protein
MPVTLAAIEEARRRIAGSALRTPLVRLNCPDAPAEVYLKLENLQPTGSFKVRGADNALARLSDESLRRGVLTASAGNMARGAAWRAPARWRAPWRAGGGKVVCVVSGGEHRPEDAVHGRGPGPSLTGDSACQPMGLLGVPPHPCLRPPHSGLG